jgi:hypothetical protein
MGGRCVDPDHGLAAPEPLDRADDLLDRAGAVEGGDELQRVGAAALVERDELLVARPGRDVDAAVAQRATP